MDLVFHCEVEGEVIYTFPLEDFQSGFILLILEISDHVREPDSKAIVTAARRGKGHVQDKVYTYFGQYMTCKQL